MVKSSDLALVLVTILFPPATAAILTGCSCDLLINIALTVLGYIPGHIHAFWLQYKDAQAEERYGHNGYVYVGNGNYASKQGGTGAGGQYSHVIQQQGPPAYGSTS